MLEIALHRRDHTRTGPIVKSISNGRVIVTLHADSTLTVFERRKDGPHLVKRITPSNELGDVALWMENAVGLSRQKSTLSVLSLTGEQFNEYAVPSHSLCSLHFNQKFLFVGDEENRVFVVTLYNNEIQIKAQFQFNSTVTAICPIVESSAFIVGIASGALFHCAEDQTVTEGLISGASSPAQVIVPIPASANKFLVGCHNGAVCQCKLDGAVLTLGENMLDENGNTVKSIQFGDYDGDGEVELAVQRGDTVLQIWQWLQNQPLMRYESKADENFGNLVGMHTFEGKRRENLLVLNYNGWVFSLLTDRTKIDAPDGEAPLKLKKENAQLRQEIEAKVDGSSAKFIKPIDVKLKTSFTKQANGLQYELSVECEMTMELIQICSDVVMNIVDDERASSDTNQAVCSIVENNPIYPLCITYRCQANMQRLTVLLRPVEGFNGELIVFVFPNLQGNKIALKKSFEIKSLSLYSRASAFTPNTAVSMMRFTGDFSASLIRDWLVICLDDLPREVPDECFYESAFTQSQLKLALDDNHVSIWSNNVTTLSVIREAILAQAVQINLQLDVTPDFNAKSSYDLLRNMCNYYGLINSSMRSEEVSQILKTLVLQENDSKIIPDSLKPVLESTNRQLTKSHYQQLSGVILDLFIDQSKCSGRSTSTRVDMLDDMLLRRDFRAILDVFQQI